MLRLGLCVVLLLLRSDLRVEAASKNDANEKKVRDVLWKAPGKIVSKDLFFGPGGREHQPRGPFVFLKEDPAGSSPKFEIRDAAGTIWRVKLGEEARPETAATRLVWSVGYFADETYLIPKLRVSGLKLSRGGDLVSPGGVVTRARLERKIPRQKKIGQWEWKRNPFTGTRELDGLRVLMALINNWDLKSENNAIHEVHGERRYVVSDLGGTFGRTGSSFTRSKGQVDDYAHSKFISHISGRGVDFHLASRPFFLTAVYWPYYQERSEMRAVVRHIPLAHVEWIAHYLTQLSTSQIEAAFRDADYSATESKAFAAAVQGRIDELLTIREGGPERAQRSARNAKN